MIYPVETALKFVPIVPHFEKESGYSDMYYITLSDIFFQIDGKYYKIESGFVSDLGSIPKIFQPFFNKAGKSILAFIIHDYCYKKDVDITQIASDLKMLKVLRYYKVSNFKSYVMYKSLRVLGRFSFNKRKLRFSSVSKRVINWILCSNRDSNVDE